MGASETWGSDHKHGLKGVQGAKSPAGVWGVPSFSFSSLAAAGGKESLKSAPMGSRPFAGAWGRPPVSFAPASAGRNETLQ